MATERASLGSFLLTLPVASSPPGNPIWVVRQGRFHPPRPVARPTGSRAHLELNQHLFCVVDRHCGVLALVRAGTDHDCHQSPLFILGKLGPRRACLIPVTALAPLLSHTAGETRGAGTSL
jgi:hypothetical protein